MCRGWGSNSEYPIYSSLGLISLTTGLLDKKKNVNILLLFRVNFFQLFGTTKLSCKF